MIEQPSVTIFSILNFTNISPFFTVSPLSAYNSKYFLSNLNIAIPIRINNSKLYLSTHPIVFFVEKAVKTLLSNDATTYPFVGIFV